MWLVSLDKKRDVDVDVFFCAVFTNNKSETSKKHVYIANEKKGRDARSRQFSLSNFPEPASFGASLVLSTILLPGKLALFRLITKFKMVESRDQKSKLC